MFENDKEEYGLYFYNKDFDLTCKLLAFSTLIFVEYTLSCFVEAKVDVRPLLVNFALVE